MSSILGLLLVLLLFTLVLHVVARVLRVAVADESCRRRPWLPTHWREPIEEGQEIRFQADDRTGLSGTFLHRLTDEHRGTVVYSHELNGDRWNALPYVEHLRAEGFDVFTFGYRDHGRSESHCCWDRALEVTETDVADLRAAVRVAASRSVEPNPRVGIVGVGKGAAIALIAASEDPAVRGLVLDSIQPLPGQAPPEQATSRIAWWRRLFTCVCQRPSRPVFDLGQLAAKVQMPVLLVHGRNDVHVNLDAVRTLASQVAGQCQLWIVPGARHAEAVQVDRNAYRRRSAKFLLHSLQFTPAPAREALPKPESAVASHGRISTAPAQ